MNSIDLSISILVEISIDNKSIEFSTMTIVHTKCNGVIVIETLVKLKCCHFAKIEFALTKPDLLLHSWLELNFLGVVISIWGVHHFWNIIDVFLLTDTSVNSDLTITFAINFKTELDSIISRYLL